MSSVNISTAKYVRCIFKYTRIPYLYIIRYEHFRKVFYSRELNVITIIKYLSIIRISNISNISKQKS